jgi:hypothetical protein
MSKEIDNFDGDPGQDYATIGGKRYRVISFPDSFFEPTRRRAAELSYDLEQERLRREAEQIRFEEREIAIQQEEEQFTQTNLDLLLIRLYMSLA